MAITVTPTVDLVNVPARVALSVTGSAGETSTTITRLNADGTTSTVRTSDGNPLPLSAGSTRTVTDGATTASSTTVTSATANFAAPDVGAAISGGSIPAGATVVSVTNTTTAVISAAATATATAVSVTITRPSTGTLYDYEMAYGQLVSYSSLETPANVSAQVSVGVTVAWLVHPGVPALSQPLDLLPGSLLDETYTVKQGVFYVMGRSTPIVQSDGARKSAQSQLVHLVSSSSERDAFRALVSDAGVLLLNIPPSLGYDFDTCYVAISDVKFTRLTDVVIDDYRTVTMPFTVVDAPVGGTMAQRAMSDLMVYASLAAVQAAYTDLTAVLVGP